MSTTPAMKARTITLKSSDEQIFVIQESVAMQSKTLEHMIAAEQKETDNIVIPLTDIAGNILAKVIDFLNKHAEVETSDEDKEIWDAQFVNFEGTDVLRDVAAAADDLDIDDLILLTGMRVFNWIKGKTPEVIRHTFRIGYQTQISSTPGKDDNIRRRNGWAFETYSVLASTNLQQQQQR